MSTVTRFGVSLNSELLIKFDALNKTKGYTTRSEAIRDLIRDELVAREWSGDEKAETVGVLSMVYDHHQNELSKVLNHIQHDHLDIIITSTHVHVDHDNCLEVIILKGTCKKIKEITNKLSSTRGVKHAKLNMTSTGSDLT
ncbi:MAG: nickel-responsive transcriptional regulator NikR [bacterium]|nr:nickel-responsive transcriptional regulator NikR [bacterium]